MIACEYMEKRPKKTFAMPFIVFATFVVPSLVVIVYVKPTAGFDALVLAGWFALVKAGLGFTLVLATLCGAIYLVRAEGKAGRIAVILVLGALWTSFWYAMR